MKSIKTTLAALFLTAAIMHCVSCKKESSTPTPKSAQEKLSGKWKLQSSVFNDFYSGTSHTSTYTGTAADYADFRNDGKVYSFVNNNYDTSAFGLISATKMYIDTFSNAFDIQTLTETNLKIYRKEIFTAGDYSESTVNFTR